MNKNIVVLFTCMIVLIALNSCSTGKKKVTDERELIKVVIDGHEYIDISSFNIHENGEEDDALLIQKVLDKLENVYFSKGDYRVASDRSCPYRYSGIFVTEKSAVRRIVFEEGAQIVVPQSYTSLTKKSCVLHFHAENGSFKELYIRGLKIIAEPRKDDKEISGLFVSETNGNLVESLILEDGYFENLSYTSITTHATDSKIFNTKTINSGFHGLAVINPYNPLIKHEVMVKDFTSIDDRRNSIDLSGFKSLERKSIASSAILENIYSKGSGNGIKIASNWNLEFSNSKILNSNANGFYVNYAHPGNTVDLKNIEIADCKKIGLSLGHDVIFYGRDIEIKNCNAGAFLQKSKATIENLTIIGNESSEFGLTMYDNGDVNKLRVSGIRAEYPIKIVGEGNTLSDVTVFENIDSHSIFVGRDAQNTKIFDANTDKDIRVLQKNGTIEICNYSGKLEKSSRLRVDCNQ